MNNKAPLEDAYVEQDPEKVEGQEPEEMDAEGMENEEFLTMTRDAYEESTDYMSSNLRRQWERNISNFMSRHPDGSKYYLPQYSNRSRLFRPKTRTSVRQNEAAAVAAFFSTEDVVSIKAQRESDQDSKISADITMELINYRLQKSIPWFKTLIAAFQETQVMDVCPARVEWVYKEVETGEGKAFKGYDEETGEEIYEEQMKVVRDQPEITLIANENLRISPGANWLDPINTTPYIIELMPMYVKDVVAETKNIDPKTEQPKWKPFKKEQLLAAVNENSNDSTRMSRENNRQDPKDQDTAITDYTIVWVYRCTMEMDGKDWIWFTLGKQAMLSDPIPADEFLNGGMRNYVLGQCIIEAHRHYPSSLVELGQDMQAASNDNLNQRFDNVKLALNSRHFVRRTAQVDLQSLKRSVPGGLVMVSDLNKDVKPIEVKDVTAPSYQEQDRFNMDFDEVMGSFSNSSVQSNRQLGETVGGMQMVKGNANAMSEYLIRVFAETWVEPVIAMLINLERQYETDQQILDLCAERAKLPEGTKVTRELLLGDIELSVNVGYGSTDPQMQMAKFALAMQTVAQTVPQAMGRLDEEEVVAEIFGKAGYKSGKRFFKSPEEAEQNQGPPPEVQMEMAKLELQKEGMVRKDVMEFNKILINRELEYAKLAQAKESTVEQIRKELGVQQGKMALDYDKHQLNVVQEMGRREDQRLKQAELSFKKRTGREGI